MYFITICTKDKKCTLGKIVGYDACDVPHVSLFRNGEVIEKYIRLMDNKYNNVFVEKNVIMPNHIHLLITVSNTSPESYDSMTRVGFYGTSQTSCPTDTDKTTLSSSQYRQHEIIPKFVSLLKRYCNHEIGHNIWQRGYYDHIIRNEEDYRSIWHYIDANPARWTDDKYYI